MGRPKGSLNRRTLLREQNMRVDEAASQLALAKDDPRRITDSLSIIEYVMRYHFRQALETETTEVTADGKEKKIPKAREEIDGHFKEAVHCAGIAINFRHPRLTAVKVGQDRENPLQVVEGKTSQEVMVELLQMIASTGVMPRRLRQLVDVTPEGVVGRTSEATDETETETAEIGRQDG